MPLTLSVDGKACVVLSNKTALGLVDEDHDLCELLLQLRTEGSALVFLRTGEQAMISLPEQKLLTTSPLQQSLALPTPPSQPDISFELECQILVPLEARVTCMATSKEDAARRVTAIFAGTSPQGPGFDVEVERDHLAETFHLVERAMRRGEIPLLFAEHDILINRIEQR